MATFQLLWLKCHETTDGFGADQVNIFFRGELLFYDGDMGEGDEWDLNDSREFTGSEKVWVKESDSEGSDELIGSFWVNDDSPGEQVVTLTGDDSHYDLRYRVVG
ncbi:hypothetical protein [Streptomyces werraensis]|jgi:hypothetical protein|uniref:hypothetical protein n=1 Tax=Streptomyces werraensis TaxID=68284 RepID=UPI0033A7CDEF